MPNERLTKKVVLLDYEKSYKNWSNDIIKIFRTLDLWNIYDQKQLCNLEVVREKLRLKCEDEWIQIIHTKAKSYIQFKMKYRTEEYLKLYMTKYIIPFSIGMSHL